MTGHCLRGDGLTELDRTMDAAEVRLAAIWAPGWEVDRLVGRMFRFVVFFVVLINRAERVRNDEGFPGFPLPRLSRFLVHQVPGSRALVAIECFLVMASIVPGCINQKRVDASSNDRCRHCKVFGRHKRATARNLSQESAQTEQVRKGSRA